MTRYRFGNVLIAENIYPSSLPRLPQWDLLIACTGGLLVVVGDSMSEQRTIEQQVDFNTLCEQAGLSAAYFREFAAEPKILRLIELYGDLHKDVARKHRRLMELEHPEWFTGKAL